MHQDASWAQMRDTLRVNECSIGDCECIRLSIGAGISVMRGYYFST